MKTPREVVASIVQNIQPFDDTESEHRQDVLEWIESGEPLFRIAKPDNPPKHLVSYFVLFDELHSSIMLIDHVKAGLWLPTGGHVDPDENPRITAIREADEELKIEAKFNTSFGDEPLFVTITTTRGFGEHTDVSLWYLVKGDREATLWYDAREMNGLKWLTLDEILAMDSSLFDPHLHRFVAKMKHTLTK